MASRATILSTVLRHDTRRYCRTLYHAQRIGNLKILSYRGSINSIAYDFYTTHSYIPIDTLILKTAVTIHDSDFGDSEHSSGEMTITVSTLKIHRVRFDIISFLCM
jgi:hypothetical protein